MREKEQNRTRTQHEFEVKILCEFQNRQNSCVLSIKSRATRKDKKVKLIARQIGRSSVVRNLCVVVLYIVSTKRLRNTNNKCVSGV